MKQKKAHIVAAIAICFAILSMAGCASSGATTRVSPPTVSAEGDGSDVLAEWGLRGEGNETTDPFDMPAGATVFQTTYSDSGPFIIELLDSNGDPVEQIASGTGPMSATKNLTLQQAGAYSLRIVAGGPWELAVSYPE